MISPEKRYRVNSNGVRSSQVYRAASYEQRLRIDQRLFSPETMNHLKAGERDAELDFLLTETAIDLLSKGKLDNASREVAFSLVL